MTGAIVVGHRARTRWWLVLGMVAGCGGWLACPARAQSLNQQGIARLNQDAQQLWVQDGLPMMRQAALDELHKLVGQQWPVINDKTFLSVVAIHSVQIDAPIAPGFTQLDGSAIECRLPLSGTIFLAVEARVRLRGKIALVRFDDSFNVRAEVTGLCAGMRIVLDSSDPAAPRVVDLPAPWVSFQIHVSSANTLVRFISLLTNGSLFQNALRYAAHMGLAYLARRVLPAVQQTPAVVGTPAGLPPVPRAGLERAATVLQEQIEATKVPFGTIFEMQYRDPYYGTWEESIRNPIPLVPGGYESIFDSTTYTGVYLAALAYRHALEPSRATYWAIVKLLRALRMVLTMKGEPGDLNRLIMPLSEYVAHFGSPGGTEYAVRVLDADYVASDYISRDCYWGVMVGLAHAYDLLASPALRSEAQALIEMAIDYLLRHNWTWRRRDGSLGERWQGALDQQYAWLLLAERVNPVKYGALRTAYQGYADLLWTGFWLAVVDPYYSYYKFELGGGALHLILKYETDPVRWQRAYQGMAILRRFIGHHQNALLNGFYLAADPGSRSALGAENENLLSRWLRMPRRKIVTDLTGDPTIEKMWYTPPTDPAFLLGSGTPSSAVLIAKSPIPLEKRLAAGSQWTVSPQRLTMGYPYAPNAHAEGESLDFLFPYWMARYYGAIHVPRPPRANAWTE
ncbi:MAG: hypothetical protein KatS3mg102_2527 [Planctomycetota bacterium]|nr:MAG: hypothetical protein KatS3mg102_2527 [Planctomycetota bacterium]